MNIEYLQQNNKQSLNCKSLYVNILIPPYFLNYHSLKLAALTLLTMLMLMTPMQMMLMKMASAVAYLASRRKMQRLHPTFVSLITILLTHYHSCLSLLFSSFTIILCHPLTFIVTHDYSFSLIIAHFNQKTPSQMVLHVDDNPSNTGKVQHSDVGAALHPCDVSVVHCATHWARSYRQSVPVWVVTILGLPPTRALVFAPQTPPWPSSAHDQGFACFTLVIGKLPVWQKLAKLSGWSAALQERRNDRRLRAADQISLHLLKELLRFWLWGSRWTFSHRFEQFSHVYC